MSSAPVCPICPCCGRVANDATSPFAKDPPRVLETLDHRPEIFNTLALKGLDLAILTGSFQHADPLTPAYPLTYCEWAIVHDDWAHQVAKTQGGRCPDCGRPIESHGGSLRSRVRGLCPHIEAAPGVSGAQDDRGGPDAPAPDAPAPDGPAPGSSEPATHFGPVMELLVRDPAILRALEEEGLDLELLRVEYAGSTATMLAIPPCFTLREWVGRLRAFRQRRTKFFVNALLCSPCAAGWQDPETLWSIGCIGGYPCCECVLHGKTDCAPVAEASAGDEVGPELPAEMQAAGDGSRDGSPHSEDTDGDETMRSRSASETVRAGSEAAPSAAAAASGGSPRDPASQPTPAAGDTSEEDSYSESDVAWALAAPLFRRRPSATARTESETVPSAPANPCASPVGQAGASRADAAANDRE